MARELKKKQLFSLCFIYFFFFCHIWTTSKEKTTPKQHFPEPGGNRGEGRVAQAVGTRGRGLNKPGVSKKKKLEWTAKLADLNAGRSIAFINSCHCLFRLKSNLLNQMVLRCNKPLCFSVNQIILFSLENYKKISSLNY